MARVRGTAHFMCVGRSLCVKADTRVPGLQPIRGRCRKSYGFRCTRRRLQRRAEVAFSASLSRKRPCFWGRRRVADVTPLVGGSLIIFRAATAAAEKAAAGGAISCVPAHVPRASICGIFATWSLTPVSPNESSPLLVKMLLDRFSLLPPPFRSLSESFFF